MSSSNSHVGYKQCTRLRPILLSRYRWILITSIRLCVNGLLLVWQCFFFFLFVYLQKYVDQPEDQIQIHLSSTAIDHGSLPEHWPLARILAPPTTDDSNAPVGSNVPTPSVAAGSTLTHWWLASLRIHICLNEDMQDAPNSPPPAATSTATRSIRRPKKKNRQSLPAPPASSTPSKKRKSKSRKAASQRSHSSVPVHRPQNQLPKLIGNTYVKVENINITSMLVMFH